MIICLCAGGGDKPLQQEEGSCASSEGPVRERGHDKEEEVTGSTLDKREREGNLTLNNTSSLTIILYCCTATYYMHTLEICALP